MSAYRNTLEMLTRGISFLTSDLEEHKYSTSIVTKYIETSGD